MPRKKRGPDEYPLSANAGLAQCLADELRSGGESGQPVIDEQEFPSGRIRVNVIWDEWDRLPLEERTGIILRAYELAEGKAYRDRIALASGLTVPEAHAAGMLPYQIIAALRTGDPVTLEQCHQAMLDEGASVLVSTGRPQLRFADEEDAEAALRRLAQRLAGSEPIWLVTQDIGAVENGAAR